jgi:hypothetical protein
MLLYDDGSFLQVLEGPRQAVETLFEKIKADRRHEQIVLLSSREIEEREFSDWQMGFVRLDRLEHRPPGYSNFLRGGGATEERGSAASRVLSSFRDGRYRNFVSTKV